MPTPRMIVNASNPTGRKFVKPNRSGSPLAVRRPARSVNACAIGPLVARMPAPGIAWLIAGGLSYTLGAIVFLLDNRVRYAHFVWHLFVLGGSVCHFFAALWYAYG